MPARKKNSKVPVAANDFALLKHPRALALSPDGTMLAYTLQWYDYDKRKSFTNLHTLDLRTGETRPWTFGEHTDRDPVWSRDGSRLAFCRREKGLDRILIIARAGGEPELAVKTLGTFGGMQWAEDDRTLIVKYRQADPDADAEKAVSEGRDPDVKAPAVRKITRLSYRMDGEGFFPADRWHLYRLPLDTRILEPLTRGKADIGVFDVSRDGRFIAYTTNSHRDPDLHPYHWQIYLYDLSKGSKRALDVPVGEKQALAFSPNGRYLVYLGHHNLRDAWSVEPVHPYLVELSSGKRHDLTPQYDRQAGDHTIADLGYGLGAPVVFWSADSRSIFYQVTDTGDTTLVRVGLRPGNPKRVWAEPGQVGLVQANERGLVLLQLGFANLGEIHFCANNTAPRLHFKSLIRFNDDYLAARELGKIKEVHFKSGDGTPLHGWLTLPPGFNPRKKYPAILEVHGGPRTQYGRVFFHEMQYLAAQGFVVFQTNPRGSQGYGKDFAGSIVAAWGTDDFNDVMAAADYLETLPYVNIRRVGITGGSYGGYMTNLAVGRTHRFYAAVTQRSVVDLHTFLGTSDIGYLDNYEFGGYQWDNPRGYEAMSPLSYADHIRTPLLILHNENDYRCAIEQAEQLFARLKILNKAPVEFWRFPEESHGMSRGGRPDRRVIRLEGIAGWFKQWLPNKR